MSKKDLILIGLGICSGIISQIASNEVIVILAAVIVFEIIGNYILKLGKHIRKNKKYIGLVIIIYATIMIINTLIVGSMLIIDKLNM